MSSTERFVAAAVDAAFDRAVRDAMRDEQKEAAMRERLKGRLGKLIGSFDDENMSYADMARYGLGKLSLDVPDEAEDPAVIAMEHFLDGRDHSRNAVGAGMDSASGDGFIARYLRGE